MQTTRKFPLKQKTASLVRAIKTRIPARLDRLPWSNFHWMILGALGITWILDGLEVTIIGAMSGVLQHPDTLHLSAAQIGSIGSAYVLGSVLGALFFGYLTDRLGRKKLFFVTLAIYLVGVLLSAFSWNVWSFAAFRLITGLGIGGEYAAINSAVDELIPARVRGHVDLTINGTYWLGAALGALSTVFLLNPRYFAPNHGWRVGFLIGGVIGFGILLLRKYVPESPRWLVLHGRHEEAEQIVRDIETRIERETGQRLETPSKALTVHPQTSHSLAETMRAMFTVYRERSILGLTLMVSQAFLYNAIFFTYAMVLTKFYNVAGSDTGLYLLPFSLGNFAGPVVLGRFFDTFGRKRMIAGTYAVSAVLLAVTGYAFARGQLTATTLTAMWSVIFFFASAAASSAYLTVSEIFPLETRGLAIALFYAIGTGVGGIVAPWLFGELIGTGSRQAIFYGYLTASLLMGLAAVVEMWIGVDAEGKSLEDITHPLSAAPSAVTADARS